MTAVILGLPRAEFEKRSRWLLADWDRRQRQTAAAPKPVVSETPADWEPRAACRTEGVNPDWFHSSKHRDRKSAKAVCAACPVQAACLADAVQRADAWGIRGGLTSQERGYNSKGEPATTMKQEAA